MAVKFYFLLTLLFASVIGSYKNSASFLPLTVEGVVQDAVTRKPLSKLHVYIKKGEEEAFTDENGSFRFKTWQALPATIVVQDPGGAEKTVTVKAVPAKLTILFP